MKYSPIVSVIVAVHNMREHIRQCIESVLDQSMQDLELILVDDASTDGTADIIREYALHDKRIHLVWQAENGGAQLARNAGVAVSQGRYITTLDHDDYLDPQALEHAIRTFDKHEALQCVCFRELRVLPDGSTIEHKQKNSFGLISGEEAYRRSISWKAITGRMIVTRELQLQYPFDNCERVYGEDNTAQLQFLASAQVCSCEGIYYHRLLDSSLSHKVSLNNIRGNLRFISMRKQLQEHGYGTEILRLNETIFWQSIVSSYQYYRLHCNDLSAEERDGAMRMIRHMREQVDMKSVELPAKAKPGYLKMPSWSLFCLQQELFFFMRRIIKGNRQTVE